jgi:hypothetical protein
MILYLILAGMLLASHADKQTQPSTEPDPVVNEVLASGRCVTLAEQPAERLNEKVKVAPGMPPLLSFRYYEGRMRHRFSNTDLVLDDAGH